MFERPAADKWKKLVVCVVLPTCAVLVGCSDRGGSTTLDVADEVAQKDQRQELGRQLLASGSDMLNNLDHFVEGGGDWRETSTEDAVRQTVRRLNEGLALLADEKAPKTELTADDGKVLREAVWLRDAARYAVGDATDPSERARRLFDWTVRNIQLTPDDASTGERLPQLPWHALVFGRGTALERAWLFQLLARQQALDVVLLAFPGTTEKDLAASAGPRWWCAALVLDGAGPDGKSPGLVLFDPRWGTPIPGPGGKGVATLAQAAADDKLLRALDIDAERPYPVRAEEIQRVTAIVEASTVYADERYARLEAALGGEEKLVLTVDAKSAAAQVARLPHVAQVLKWKLRDLRFEQTREKETYDALSKRLLAFSRRPIDLTTGKRFATPPLWRARIRHVCGKFYDNMEETDPELRRPMINRWYQTARPAAEELKDLELDALNWEQLNRMKQHATYWLGLVAYEQGNYDTAVTYLEKVLADEANGGWTTGARYNLGRTYEALASAEKAPAAAAGKRLDQAIEVYRKTYLGVAPDAECLYRALRVAERRAAIR